MQELIKKTVIIAALLTDIVFTYAEIKDRTPGKGLWKFNSTLSSNDTYVEKIQNLIHVLIDLYQENISDNQIRWEF